MLSEKSNATSVIRRINKAKQIEMRKITNSELGRLTPEEFAAAQKLPVVVVLDNVRSAGNVGSFFRTCDAFGIGRIALCGICATPPSREIHKTALGAEQTIPWDYYQTTTEAIATLRAEGYTIVAIEQVEGAKMLDQTHFSPDQPVALIFGNEVEGVSQEAVDGSDWAIEIPQVGTKHSLNVAVTGGAVLWELFRQMRNKTQTTPEK